MLLLSCTEDGNVNPNLDRPRIKFRLLASTAVLYRPDLIQAPQRRKEGKELKEKKQAWGWEKASPDRLWHVSICSYFIKWPSSRLLLVPMMAHLSSLCLLSFSELTEGPQVISRDQPGVGEGTKAHGSQMRPSKIRCRVAPFTAHQPQSGFSVAQISQRVFEDGSCCEKLIPVFQMVGF